MFECEVSARKILPIIRKELAIAMKAEGMKTGEISKILETSPAAISQYISGKRGHMTLLKGELKTIHKMAKNHEKMKKNEICKLCKEVSDRIRV